MKEESLNMEAKLILDTDGVDMADLCMRAQRVWIDNYGPPRVHTKDRIDKGVPKKWSTKTETAMRRDRRDAAASLVADSLANGVVDLEDATAAAAPGWTQSHEDELQFQTRKRRHIQCETMNAGHLLPSECDAKLPQEAAAPSATQHANTVKLARAAARSDMVVAGGGP